MSDDERTPVTREELIALLDPSGDDRHIGRAWAGMVFHPRQAAAVADAILAEFTVTRKGEQTDSGRPHSRACGWMRHDHGRECSYNCPTCHGADYSPKGTK